MFKKGDHVYSRVYGFGVVRKVLDEEHIEVQIPNDDAFILNVATVQPVGSA